MNQTIKLVSVLVVGLALVALGFVAYTALKTPNTIVGSVSGPDSFFPCETHNGVTTCSESKAFNTGSTTLATFKSPNATSTLSAAVATFGVGSSTALMFEWGRSLAQDATTTSLGQFFIPAEGRVTLVASTSPGAFTGGVSGVADAAYIIPPNTYVTLKYGKSVCVTGGTCSALRGRASVEFKY
jgi:hypothetical protein